MEYLAFLVLFVLVLVVLDVLALKFGKNMRRPETNGNSYDPRYDWNSQE
jgi:hypothetical protein